MYNKKELEYLNASKEFAIKQLIEKWQFEIAINKKIFNRELTLNELISETHSVITLTYDEYKEIYERLIND